MSFALVNLLQKPTFSHLLSASLHLVLLLVIFVSWVWKKFALDASDCFKEKFIKSSQYKRTLFFTFGAFALNLAMGLLYCLYWYGYDWSYEKFVTLWDLALKTVAWGILCASLRAGLFNSSERRFPLFFRAWCVFYLLISCYCFVLDIILHLKHVLLPIQCLISDGISFFLSLFFCYMVFFVKHEGEDNILQEPLLNDVSNALEFNKTKGKEHVTPYSNAGIFSILTFSLVGPLIDAGKRKTLNLEDVPKLASCDRVVEAFPAFRNELEDECGTLKRVTTLKLAKSLILSSWKGIFATAIVALLNTLTSYVGPFLIDTFVQYLNGKQTFKNEGYVLVAAFLAAKLIECLSHRQWFFRLKQVGIKTRALLMTVIYSKGLTLSCQSKQGHTTGEIINFMIVDAERVGDFAWNMHDPWIVVLQVALAMLILYRNLGMASIAAFIATVAVMLTNFPFVSLQEKYRRMKATSEILRNMRILKLQGWEMKFLSNIIDLRNTEQSWLRKYVYTSAMTTFVLRGAPEFVSMVTFCTCVLIGIPLESGKILSAIATFRMLQEPVYRLPEIISMIAQTKVSLDRIASFLSLDDLQPNVVEKIPRGSSNIAVELIDGNFSWDFSSPNTTLKGVNLTILQGMRVAVCGTVGSGKSSLLSCILGEVPKISGILRVCGTKAFVAQSPWIQSGTIEENILFGKERDRERYEKVLEACSLNKDLEILPFGDQTFIGERRINLSGGQKQRIQIARALYQDADIYLFDDPFSAVDAHTGSHLFKVMKDGEITQCGRYNDILNSGTDFLELVGAHRKALSALDSFDGGEVFDELNAKIIEEKETNKDRQSVQIDVVVEPRGQLIQEEEREKGRVGFSVYLKYITTTFGGALVPFILLA